MLSLFDILTDVIRKFEQSTFTFFTDASFLTKRMALIRNYNMKLPNDVFYNGFEPICLLPTLDIFCKKSNIINIIQATTLKNVCKFGRPLWGGIIM